MNTQTLFSQLEIFNDRSTYIEASAIISQDGMVMASALPQEINEDHIGAMSAAILSVGNRGSRELIGGELEQIMIKSAKGYILMIHAGKEAMLTVMTKPNARLEFVFLEMSQLAKRIAFVV